jgi:predicted nucleotidyltransferase
MAEASLFLQQRRTNTDERFLRIQQRVQSVEPILGDFATVYVTGSYGRGEASDYSDLDAFILSDTDAEKRAKLSPVDTIRVQKALVEAEGLPPFTDEGAYLKPHSISDMIEKLGGPDDDYENLFTARMLLLLESRPLLGSVMYERAIDRVL